MLQEHFFVGWAICWDISRQVATQTKTSEHVTLFGQSFTSIIKNFLTLCAVSVH